PSSVTDDPADQTCLLADFPDQLIDVDDVSLELDHEDRPTTGMPRDDVDHAAFPIDRVRDFRGENPRRKLLGEPSSDEFMELRVLRVQQAVEVSSAPPRYEIDTDVE